MTGTQRRRRWRAGLKRKAADAVRKNGGSRPLDSAAAP
jgi:hypothetical protein